MKIFVPNAWLVAPGNPAHGTIKHVIIDQGKIYYSENREVEADMVIKGKRVCISPGFFDMRTAMNDPGMEHKEDISSLCKAAAHGGFTGIATLPNTKPAVQTKESLQYIIRHSENKLTRIYPMASVSLDNKGTELTEMLDLHHAGAIAFTDGDKPIWHADLMLRALQYVQPFEGLIINHPEEPTLTHGAQINESPFSTKIGLKGFPKLAEELMVARDIQLLEHCGGQLHISCVSSPKSVELITSAKHKGLHITCDIAAHTLCMDETLLNDFDTNYKVTPPLRSHEDILQLRAAVLNNEIDVIVSDHTPQDIESKKLEFDMAEFGMSSIETMFSLLLTQSGLPLDCIVQKITTAPRSILKLPLPSLENGSEANIVIYDTDDSWEVTETSLYSKSKNTPLLNTKLNGKILATIAHGKIFYDGVEHNW